MSQRKIEKEDKVNFNDAWSKLLLGLLVKDSTIISKHDFEHDTPQIHEKTQMQIPK